MSCDIAVDDVRCGPASKRSMDRPLLLRRRLLPRIATCESRDTTDLALSRYEHTVWACQRKAQRAMSPRCIFFAVCAQAVMLGHNVRIVASLHHHNRARFGAARRDAIVSAR
jgi:hypothetical protein